MDIVRFVLLLAVIVLAAVWLRDQLLTSLWSRYRALIFISLHSRETENVFGTQIPSSKLHLSKVVLLKSQPLPGVELDGLGTGPLKIARAVVDEDAEFNIFLQLTPLVVPLDEIEPYANSLVANLGWKRLNMEPPYPAEALN